MTPSERIDLKRRAQSVLRCPVPSSVANGDAVKASRYRESAALVAGYVRTGHGAERARLVVIEMESLQERAGAAAGQACAARAAAPAIYPPPSNTGGNKQVAKRGES
jgi:hypothetical protein